MNLQECRQLIDAYLDWLRKGLSVEHLGQSCELTTPFLDRHNDHLQIYASTENGKIILSDDGYILADLRTSGLEMVTPKRKAVLQSILNGFGVKTDGKRLFVETSSRNLAQKMHSLIQAMISINDMFVMAQPRVSSFFWEDVRDYLDKHEVRYSSRVKISGRSGYDHAVDFLIPKSRTRPERIVQAINAPDRNTISSYLFILEDTYEIRGEESEAYAFLNDQHRTIGGDVIEALEVYKVIPVLWSQREKEKYVEALAG
jgi:hypothetical protein